MRSAAGRFSESLRRRVGKEGQNQLETWREKGIENQEQKDTNKI